MGSPVRFRVVRIDVVDLYVVGDCELWSEKLVVSALDSYPSSCWQTSGDITSNRGGIGRRRAGTVLP